MNESAFIEDAENMANSILDKLSENIDMDDIIFILTEETKWLIQNNIIPEGDNYFYDVEPEIFNKTALIRYLLNECSKNNIFLTTNEINKILEVKDYYYKFIELHSFFDYNKELLN